MHAELITLEGDNDFNIGYTPYYDDTMDGIGDFFKTAGKFIATPFIATGKGVGHFFMEAGRGIKSGDIKKVAFSPFKGIGHIGGTAYRAAKEHAEYYWRPSKMREWMSPLGMAITAAGAIPGPHSLIMLPLGAALTAGGSISEGIYQKDRQKIADAAEKKYLEDSKKKNLMWTIGGIALLGVGAYMAFK